LLFSQKRACINRSALYPRARGGPLKLKFVRGINVVLAAVIMLSVIVVGGLQASRESDFDRLLRLAAIADQQYDAIPEDWPEAQPKDWFEFQTMALTIISQFVEEEISEGVVPKDIRFVEYGMVTRSKIAGTYTPESNVVGLNARYVTDPVWLKINYQSVLVHELVHAQGYHNESETEAITAEVMAALANLNYPGFRKDFWDGIRRDALGTAYFIARYGGDLIHTTDSGDFGDLCLANCEYKANPAQMAQLQAARQAIFTPDELRRTDKRLRFWTNPNFANAYLFVLAQYSVKPMTAILDVACESSPIYENSFHRVLVSRFNGVLEEHNVKTDPLPIDDIAYLFEAAGFCE